MTSRGRIPKILLGQRQQHSSRNRMRMHLVPGGRITARNGEWPWLVQPVVQYVLLLLLSLLLSSSLLLCIVCKYGCESSGCKSKPWC